MPGPNIPFYLHHLGEREARSVAEVLKTPMLTTGAEVAAFERDFARYLGVREVVGLTSCTDALHLALYALGLGPGDEVITTPQTFIATFHVILRVGATPVLVDVEPDTGLIGPEAVRTAITTRTRAILPVHLYGRMCDMRGLGALADEHGLFIVEDAAHCVEGRRDGIRPGQAADMACFSFYATKNLTSGEGGAIALQDAERAARLRRLRVHGLSLSAEDRHAGAAPHYDVQEFGFKCNMSNLQAALLNPQLPGIAARHARRTALEARMRARLTGVPGIALPPTVPPGETHAHHLLVIFVPAERRAAIIAGLRQRGIGTAINFQALHRFTAVRRLGRWREGDFPVAERIADTALTLPFYPRLTDEQADAICDAVRATI